MIIFQTFQALKISTIFSKLFKDLYEPWLPQTWWSSGLRSDELGTTHSWWWIHSSVTWSNSKLVMVKATSTCRTINTIFMNIKINLPKLVNMHGYKLATDDKISQKYKWILQKFYRKSAFLTCTVHAICMHQMRCECCNEVLFWCGETV